LIWSKNWLRDENEQGRLPLNVVGDRVVEGVGLVVKERKREDARNVLFGGACGTRSLLQEHSPGGATI